MFQSSAASRGAAPGRVQESNLLSAAENEPLPLQTRIAPSSASMTAPSMAELNMIMKTLQTMVPEFPKLEIGELGTRPRRLQQWLLSVTQALGADRTPCYVVVEMGSHFSGDYPQHLFDEASRSARESATYRFNTSISGTSGIVDAISHSGMCA